MEESFILSKFDHLVKSGLVLYDDKQESIEHIDGGLKFRFLLTSALAKKPTIQTSQPQAGGNSELHQQRRDGSDISTEGFEIGDIGGAHFLAANKFCFARPHLMLLTSDGHRRQYEPLDESDLGAVWAVQTALGRDYVAFFNCGRDGGCSRLHKHLQLIPAPEDSFASFLDDDSEGGKGKEEPEVPFRWFYHRFESGYQHVTAAGLAKVYNDLLGQVTEAGAGRSEHAGSALPGAACPHNMILTKRWMLVIPRRRAAVNEEAGVNSIGMLGLIAVATRKEIDNWVRLGLTDALRELGVPK